MRQAMRSVKKIWQTTKTTHKIDDLLSRILDLDRSGQWRLFASVSSFYIFFVSVMWTRFGLSWPQQSAFQSTLNSFTVSYHVVAVRLSKNSGGIHSIMSGFFAIQLAMELIVSEGLRCGYRLNPVGVRNSKGPRDNRTIMTTETSP